MSGRRFPEIRDNLNAVQQITELANMTRICAAGPAGIPNDWATLTGDNGVTREAIRCPTLIIHVRADPYSRSRRSVGSLHPCGVVALVHSEVTPVGDSRWRPSDLVWHRRGLDACWTCLVYS